MNKSQYKQLSSRVRAAFTACVEARCVTNFNTNRVAAKIARRIGVKPIKLNRCAIISGAYSRDELGDFSPGRIAYQYEHKQWLACHIALGNMLDTVKYLDGWRVVDITPADTSEHIEITPIEVYS